MVPKVEPGSCFGKFDFAGCQGCQECFLQDECRRKSMIPGVVYTYDEKMDGIRDGRRMRQVIGGLSCLIATQASS